MRSLNDSLCFLSQQLASFQAREIETGYFAKNYDYNIFFMRLLSFKAFRYYPLEYYLSYYLPRN